MTKTAKLTSKPRAYDVLGGSYTGNLSRIAPRYPAVMWLGTKHLPKHEQKVLAELFGMTALVVNDVLDENAETNKVMEHLAEACAAAQRSYALSNADSNPLMESAKTRHIKPSSGNQTSGNQPSPQSAPVPQKPDKATVQEMLEDVFGPGFKVISL